MRVASLSFAVAVACLSVPSIGAFTSTPTFGVRNHQSLTPLLASREATAAPAGFIEKELRGAAMKLHTRSQAPKEGQAKEEPQEQYVTTHEDYLQFLVDSKHVYEAMEDVVNEKEELSMFRSTGLERTTALEQDIEFMCQEYDLARPEVGAFGIEYANEMRRIAKEGTIPEFMCHYYNFYFAHTAGGRMIGKQMAALLLDKKTLEFYKVHFLFCNACFGDAL